MSSAKRKLKRKKSLSDRKSVKKTIAGMTKHMRLANKTCSFCDAKFDMSQATSWRINYNANSENPVMLACPTCFSTKGEQLMEAHNR